MHGKTEQLIIETFTEWLGNLPGQALISGMLEGISKGAAVASELLAHDVEDALRAGRRRLVRREEREARCELEEDGFGEPVGHEAVLKAELAQLEAEVKTREREAQLRARIETLKASLKEAA